MSDDVVMIHRSCYRVTLLLLIVVLWCRIYTHYLGQVKHGVTWLQLLRFSPLLCISSGYSWLAWPSSLFINSLLLSTM